MINKAKLSKSNYIKGIQCSKALWFDCYQKDLKPEIDQKTQNIFEAGKEVDELARKCFTDGKIASQNYFDIEESTNLTRQIIDQGFKVIFEATAINEIDESHARIDILQKNDDGKKWNLIEVKSSTKIKDYHIDDVAFQYHVFSKAGYDIEKCLLMLVDNSYILEGAINPNKFFKIEDITDKVKEKQNEVDSCKEELLRTLENKEEPKIEIGAKCSNPFECEYKYHCWKDVPKYSVFDIYQKKKAEKIVAEIDSYNIEDIPKKTPANHS